jgi:hypothetical protein
MALSKANLQKLFIAGKIIIMPILAGLALLYLLDFHNLKLPYLPPQEANLVKLKMIILASMAGWLLLFNEIFWGRIIMIAIAIIGFTPLYLYNIKLLPAVIFYLVCLYSIDIFIFMVRFLRMRIHQHHTPR